MLPCVQAGTWYMDRKNEVPEGKVNYYVLPVVHYHQVSSLLSGQLHQHSDNTVLSSTAPAVLLQY